MLFVKNKRELYWISKEKYGGKKPPAFFIDKKRLISGEPVDYIIGSKPFLGCDIDLSFKPLIPRPETEYWVERVIETIPKNKKIDVLDIFSGSGCIGIAILKHLPKSQVDFSDKYKRCIKQIEKNIKLNNLDKRATIIQGNIFSNINKKYDYIFANPPYVSHSSRNVQKSVLDWEPRNAILSKNNGFDLIGKTIIASPNHLKEGGTVFIEHDPHQKQEIHQTVGALQYKKIISYKDQYKKYRITRLNI